MARRALILILDEIVKLIDRIVDWRLEQLRKKVDDR